MGGLGSGRWQAYDAKQLVEHARFLGLEDCKRAGLCYGGSPCRGTMTWPDGWTSEFFFRRNTLTLIYTREPRGQSARPITVQVQIVATSPNYGGGRPWFACPDCGRKCRKLYVAYNGYCFTCRLCAHLVHKSTRMESECLVDKIERFNVRQARAQAVVNRKPK